MKKLILITFIGFSVVLSGCGPSVKQIDKYKNQCIEFVSNSKNSPSFLNPTNIKFNSYYEDHWMKDGYLIISVISEAKNNVVLGDNRDLCIVDLKNDQIRLPSMLEGGKWKWEK